MIQKILDQFLWYIAKVFEKLISDQLLNYFETNYLLHDYQGAYHCSRLSDQITLY